MSTTRPTSSSGWRRSGPPRRAGPHRAPERTAGPPQKNLRRHDQDRRATVLVSGARAVPRPLDSAPLLGRYYTTSLPPSPVVGLPMVSSAAERSWVGRGLEGRRGIQETQ